ncbi:penicillin-binding protein [Paenibacillus cellulosilyticus]|uniref:Penicillin-binding protein n=1 Tax=Paenibacillus cellulosilyticus TaxID=375489 RepID=A0A2V2YZB5_9BACL|nr:transglycosylase domain-containing protein [Paenibacillus cellulosilyticus]PWW06165.1 penicillin-binding protein [Paenibacillus cellulosilyticus]QKS43067.1 transglycosylase domain-containing protein [Paenibacillus cellulosilyticus]
MTDGQKPSSPAVHSKWRVFGLVVWITFKWMFIFGLMIGLFAGGIAAGYVASLVKDEPVRPRALIEQKLDENSETGFVYFNDNVTPVGQLRTQEDRRLVETKDIPQVVINAVLATEDNNFYQHFGIDLKGTARAVLQKVLNKDTQTGGSTLTQQIARRMFLSLDKTDSRKVKEIFLAIRMERFLTKDEILTAYLNKVPFGNSSSGYNLYGIKAAAKGIFNISDLNQLNIAQAAYLAGLPQRPSAYTAYTGKGEWNEKGLKLAIERQHNVLTYMLNKGRINQQEYDEAMQFDIRSSMAQPSKKAYSTFPYLMLEAERQAAQILLMQENPELTKEEIAKNATLLEDARDQLQRGGYRVYTTIDKKVYNLMHEIGENPDNFAPDSTEKGIEQIAAIMIDHRTGAILGMLEGRDFYEEQMNFATQMTRQPGSTMKPIAAYLPALEKGLIQPAGVLDDAPIVLKDYQKGFHIPKNSNDRYLGLVTAREALNRSLNLPALKLFLNKVTIPTAWEFARSLGITTLQPEDDNAQTGVIGGLSKGVTVEEMTNAYGSIPNNGVFNDAYMISKITDATGKVVYEHKAQPKRVFSEQTAFLMTDMLRTVISDPNGTAHSLVSTLKQYGKIPMAGKTGSTSDYGDVWFMGFTPDVSLGVWAGYEKSIHTLSKDGRTRARSIWAMIMNSVTDAKPELFPTKEWSMPDGIVRATVSSVSGKLPTDLTKQAGKLVTDYFNKKYLPKEADDALVNMAYIPFNNINYIPNEATPSDMVRQQVVIKREKPIDQLMAEIQKAQEALPASQRRALSFYMPQDAKNDAPSTVDPRIDDGSAPTAPANVRLTTVSGTTANISFNASPEADVVGYRLYRADSAASSFKQIGTTILVGEQTVFKTDTSGGSGYSYYVTAVDVVGKESSPSRIVGANPNQQTAGTGDGVEVIDPNLGLGDVTGTDQGGGSTGGDTGSSADNGTLPAPSTPTGFKVEASNLGVKLTWNSNPVSDQVTGYTVYYSADSNGKYVKLGSTADTSFEYVAIMTKGTYQIRAVNEHGESTEAASFTYNP